MYGWRARIGHISATPSEHFPYEFYKISPEGVVCVPTCVYVDRVIKEELDKQREELLRVVKGLAKAEVDYIIVGGAPLIFVAGLGEDKRLLAQIREITPIPATTDITCTMDAFKYLGVKKVAIATPLRDEINQKLKAYLENEGYQVLAIKNLEILRIKGDSSLFERESQFSRQGNPFFVFGLEINFGPGFCPIDLPVVQSDLDFGPDPGSE